MSEQTNPLFKPFVPVDQAPVPFTETPATVPAAPKPKRGRKKQTAAEPARKPAAPKPPKDAAPAAPRFDLQTILRAAALLREDDYSVFEPLLNMLSPLPKGQRDRLLAAIDRVFG